MGGKGHQDQGCRPKSEVQKLEEEVPPALQTGMVPDLTLSAAEGPSRSGAAVHGDKGRFRVEGGQTGSWVSGCPSRVLRQGGPSLWAFHVGSQSDLSHTVGFFRAERNRGPLRMEGPKLGFEQERRRYQGLFAHETKNICSPTLQVNADKRQGKNGQKYPFSHSSIWSNHLICARGCSLYSQSCSDSRADGWALSPQWQWQAPRQQLASGDL